MDTHRSVRSRTNSISCVPVTPATSSVCSGRTVLPSYSGADPELLSVVSIPPTPAPTPNPQHSTNHMVPEQLAAGIKQLRVDEGYIDSTSIPGTPAASPYSHSPAPRNTVYLSADQVAESIRRLRDEDCMSEPNTGLPPTPSSTPGPAQWAAHALGVIPEHLVQSIQHLRSDEGVESTSHPGTPIPTPISPLLHHPNHNQAANHQVLPEQLAAGIHRLKVEEGMSSGGSSDFPSTPAPTPLMHHPGGVRPEELAAGISRLSVIEEGDAQAASHSITIRADLDESCSQPNLSQYFGGPDQLDGASGYISSDQTFFDQLSSTAVLPSCRESKISLRDTSNTEDSMKHADSCAKLGIEQLSCEEQGNSTASFSPKPSFLITSSPQTEGESLYATPSAETVMLPVCSEMADTSGLQLFTDDSNLTADFLRRRDAWIPCAATGQVLEAIQKDASARQMLERSSLTLPGIHLRENLQDPVKSLMLHYKGESEAQKRQILTTDMVSEDMAGLHKLIQAGCFRAAVNLTGRLLHQCHQGLGQQGHITAHSPSSLQVWYTRLALLIKLKEYSIAEVESEAFGELDTPDLYYEFYSDSSRRGSMVPFSFRLLLAELPHHLGKPHDALDRLYGLVGVISKMIQNLESGYCETGQMQLTSPDDVQSSLALWKQRRLCVYYSICNCAVSSKDFDLAVNILEKIIQMEGVENQPKARSALGRVFLQMGDLLSASNQYDKAKELRSKMETTSTATQLQAESLMDQAFLAVASNNYAEALSLFEEASRLCPDNVVLVVNSSVCLLYLGRLKEAIELLECRIMASPQRYLQDTAVLNCATLYELESSFAGHKKKRLLDLMNLYSGDGVNINCLKF